MWFIPSMAQTMRLGLLLRALFTQRHSQTEAQGRGGPVWALLVVMTPGQLNDKRGTDGWGWSQTLQKTNRHLFEAIPSQEPSQAETGASPGCILQLSQRSPHTTWGETLIFKTFISSSFFLLQKSPDCKNRHFQTSVVGFVISQEISPLRYVTVFSLGNRVMEKLL